MSELDLLVRGGLAALPDRMEHLDVGVHEGRIVALGHNLEYRAAAILEASGLILLPGLIDSAVRLGGPEGFGPGSAALAAGGATCFIDLPGAAEHGPGEGLPVFDRDDFHRKRDALRAGSRLDFALWGAVSPRNLYELAVLRDCGAVGFHASLCRTGIDDLPPISPAILRLAMKQAAKLGRPLLLHVEGAGMPLGSPESELEGIGLALELAGETGCALHLAHLTLPEAAALAAGARERGVDVTAATAPHYLLFDAATPASYHPPLRPAAARAGLEAAWRAGRIDLLSSGGRHGALGSARHGFAELCATAALAPENSLPLAATVARLASRAADRFGLAARKGALEMGRDADFALLDLDETQDVDDDPEREGPYTGRTIPGRIVRTMQRGRTVFANGELAKVAKAGEACFIRP